MDRRNWLDLSRKLVDKDDLDYSITAIQRALGKEALANFGFGVLLTPQFPTPFVIQLDAVTLDFVVGEGIAYDPNGQNTRIDADAQGNRGGVLTANNSGLPRWDILVMRYKPREDQLVPKPSDPILTVPLNLVDDFEIQVILGTPSNNPVYPAKGPNDIILNGFRSEDGDVVAQDFVVDNTVTEYAMRGLVNLPIFIQEYPTGLVNGANQNFTLSKVPLSAGCLNVFLDGVRLEMSDWTLITNTVTIAEAPTAGQSVYVAYVANDPTSQNPLTAVQETPVGAVDGLNKDFLLTGKAPTQEGTYVFINGLKVPKDSWALIQTDTYSLVRFNDGEQPVGGQTIEVAYFVNPATVGTAGAPGPTPPIAAQVAWLPKIQVTHNQLQAPAMTSSFNLINLLNQAVHAVVIRNAQAVTGMGLSSYKLSVGTDEFPSLFAVDHNGMLVATDSNHSVFNSFGVPKLGTLTPLKVFATSTDANLDQSVSGLFDIHLLVSELQ